MGTYKQSIRAVNIACAQWEIANELADISEDAMFEAFERAKHAHRLAFGPLRRVNGEWV